MKTGHTVVSSLFWQAAEEEAEEPNEDEDEGEEQEEEDQDDENEDEDEDEGEQEEEEDEEDEDNDEEPEKRGQKRKAAGKAKAKAKAKGRGKGKKPKAKAKATGRPKVPHCPTVNLKNQVQLLISGALPPLLGGHKEGEQGHGKAEKDDVKSWKPKQAPLQWAKPSGALQG